MFSWAKYRTAKGGIKIHTSFDSNTMMPDIINITEAKLHDRYGLVELVYPSDTIIVEDRAYFDFLLMLARIKANNHFVTRIKVNTVYKVVKELGLPEHKDQDILKDEIIVLSSPKAIKTAINKYQLRLIKVYKPDENKAIEIITNNLEWSARTIADLYKKR